MKTKPDLSRARDKVHAIFMEHSPALADDVPLDGLVDDLAKAMVNFAPAQNILADLYTFNWSEFGMRGPVELGQGEYISKDALLMALAHPRPDDTARQSGDGAAT